MSVIQEYYSESRVIKPKYQYKSGATYEGEWLEGRRDG